MALIENEDFRIGKKIDAVYIPPNVDEITDEEVYYHYPNENAICLPDIAGTFEVHMEFTEESDEIEMPYIF